MMKDVRYAVRQMLQARGWTAVIVVSLALGIGANTALFSAVNGLFLTKLAVDQPDSLVRLRWAGRNDMSTSGSDYGVSGTDGTGRNVRASFSYPIFQQFRADNQTMSDLLACAPLGQVNVTINRDSALASAFVATGNYFQMLHVRPVAGRLFAEDDDRASAPPVAVISHAYWQSRFGGQPDAVGRVVRINNVPVTVIGVSEPSFAGLQRTIQRAPDVTLPLALYPQLSPEGHRFAEPARWWLQVVGRLKPGRSVAQVQANLEQVFRQAARAGLDAYLGSLSDQERSTAANRRRVDVPNLSVDSASRGIYHATATDTRTVTLLSAVVVLVLLIVCANVANLLLSRAAARQREISVRLSLGATRTRLVRQLLTESLLLAVIGGLLGVVIGYWGRQLLPGPPGQTAPLDWRMLAFVTTVTLLTAVVFGLAPALKVTSGDVNAALKEQSRAVLGSRSALTKTLLVTQMSMSLVLLIGAGLFLQTVQNLRQVNLGFNADNLVLFRVNPQLNRYDETRTAQLYRELLDRIGAVGGVLSVGLSQPALLSGGVNSTSAYVHGRPASAEPHHKNLHRMVVSPGFFAMMELPVLRGRGVTSQDSDNGPKVVVINEAAAREMFPGEEPIGQRFGQSVETSGDLEIVGVVRDAKYNSLREPAPATMYVPHLQARATTPSFAVRTAGDPMSVLGSIRAAVQQVDPDLPMADVTTQLANIEQRMVQERLFAQAYALFSGLALVLACIGLFGVMSNNVSRRINEIGVRMAIGAERRDVLQLVVGEAMVLVVVGAVIGTVVALAAGRLVASQLFEVTPGDPATMAVAVVVLVSIGALAGYLPARRAAAVDPMVALRHE